MFANFILWTKPILHIHSLLLLPHVSIRKIILLEYNIMLAQLKNLVLLIKIHFKQMHMRFIAICRIICRSR